VLRNLKKSFRVILMLFILLFTILNGTIAAKPSNSTTNLIVSTSPGFKNIVLNYKIENTRKVPDQYIIKRGAIIVYEGPNTSFYDDGLHSDTIYSYTVEAWLNGRLLAKTTHNASTKSIIIKPIEVTAALQPDHSVVMTWVRETSELTPDQYKIILNGNLAAIEPPIDSSIQTATLPDLQPGTHFVTIEGWFQDELVSQGSQSVTVPEPITKQPIHVSASVYSDFSADILISTLDLQVDSYTIFLDELEVFKGPIDQSVYSLSSLTPAKEYLVRVEAYYEGNMVGAGSITFTTPYKINIDYDFSDFDTREALISFSYDNSQQIADRMVITRQKVILVNGIPTEESNSEVIYDGEPIYSLVENQFNSDVIRYNYYVVNYEDNLIVGSGKTSVPNIFDY
jgi:hypothetical protein